MYKIGQGTVRRILKANGIQPYDQREYYKKYGNNFGEIGNQIIDLFEHRNKTPQEIGKIFNVDPRAVNGFLRKRGISSRIADHQSVLLRNKETAIEIYRIHERLSKVAEHFGCSSDAVSLFFDHEKIAYKKYRNHNTYVFSDTDRKIIVKLINEHKSLKEIAALYECTAPKIASYCKRNDVYYPSRSIWSADNGCKSINATFRRKSYVLPSGKIIHVQGYEPQFLDYVLQNELLSEDEIVYKAPRIDYVVGAEKRRYFPDFYIPRFNLITEIKSSWVLERQTIQMQHLKERATIAAGFDYIMILDNDFGAFKYKYFKDMPSIKEYSL